MRFLLDMARRHNIELRLQRLEGGVRGYSIPERTIVVDLDLSEERMNWTFCHELAHLLLKHGSGERPISTTDEKEAHELAQDLILPPETFRTEAQRLSLNELKARYPHASWEVVARTRVRHRPAVLTIFDNGRRTLRMAPPPLSCPSRLHPLERELRHRVEAGKTAEEIHGEGLHVEGVFVDEDRGVHRIILITQSEE
ncbi:MAG: ImmA/IrrE family metallo-endopeptidase [bacterium]